MKTHNPSTWESEEGRPRVQIHSQYYAVSLKSAWATRDTVSKQNKKAKKNLILTINQSQRRGR